jgi:hypothetical protein
VLVAIHCADNNITYENYGVILNKQKVEFIKAAIADVENYNG